MHNTLPFSKMHGLGNDFIVIQDLNASLKLSSLPISNWSDRKTGIGFDQMIVILPSKKADFACKFFNADGSEAEQCGNGIRCAARFVFEEKLTQKKSLQFETLAGIIPVDINDFNHIRANMGAPQSKPTQIILSSDTTMTTLSMGNPHAIIRVDSIDNAPVKTLGSELQKNKHFPQGVNVGFIEVINTNQIHLRTFERGVGETLCCGSNACAAAVAGITHHGLKTPVTIELPLGHLTIEWNGDGHPVYMTGPAENIIKGQASY